jgi:hypothetical protein
MGEQLPSVVRVEVPEEVGVEKVISVDETSV